LGIIVPGAVFFGTPKSINLVYLRAAQAGFLNFSANFITLPQNAGDQVNGQNGKITL